MRNLFIVVLSLVIGTTQAQDCEISRERFNPIVKKLSYNPTDQILLDNSIQVMRNNCLTSFQVKRIATLFENDKLRLVFARRAYRKVLNPEGYFIVMDAFNKFSSAFYLYDFIQNVDRGYDEEDDFDDFYPTDGSGEVIVIVEPVPVFEECYTTAEEFNSLTATLKRENFPMRRLDLAKSLVKNWCLDVKQIKGIIGLLAIGGDRVEFAKATYDNCPNPLDYHQVIDAMTFQSDKDELLRFIQSKQ